MIYWLWLSLLKGIGSKTGRILLEHFHTPKEIYEADADELRAAEKISESRIRLLLEQKSLERAEQVYEACRKNYIRIMTYQDSEYPILGKNILEMPLILYYRGIPRIDENWIAIVGARRCSREGRQHAIDEAIRFTEAGKSIVSGMAKGIDAYAQTACLHHGGYTVAVLGCGVDICYPPEHAKLKQKIEEQGLVLSEYAPGVCPRPFYFPARNRIIAAISSEIIVAEAGRNSGAHITAEFGMRYHRPVKEI